MPRARTVSFAPVAILAILLTGIIGMVIFGVGASKTPHSVQLNWRPPQATKTPVVSYEIYRSEDDGPFQKLASGLSAPSYVDRSVSSRKTYHYFVRAVDSNGAISPPSNQATATIPFP
jgi:fibronectin type 3 domain-containing protein